MRKKTHSLLETMPKSQRRNRKQRKTRRQQGGAGPVGVYDLGALSDSQGATYQNAHRAQHGGMAPVGYTGVLEGSELRLSAGVTPLDAAIEAVKHVRDPGQAGGRRRKSGKKSRKSSKKSRKASKKSRKASKKSRKSSKKSRKATRRTRRQRRQSGGASSFGVASDYYGDAKGPHMLLSPAMESRAGLNPEWTLAKNPNSFAPQLR
jgi:hypothetical protein